MRDVFLAFKDKNIFVIGDAMIDRYITGDVNRLSPEAPVPVLEMRNKKDRLGGAANVALNIRNLGGVPILLTSVGNDKQGHRMIYLLKKMGIMPEGVLIDIKRHTTLKTRVMHKHHQLLRLDRETRIYMDEEAEISFLDKFYDLADLNPPEVIILEDYNKGTLSPRIIRDILHYASAKKIPVAVDPKFVNFDAYHGVHLLKPNLAEANAALGRNIPVKDEIAVLAAATELRERMNAQYLIITLGSAGMVFCSAETTEIIPAIRKKIYDVSGAGDTVIALLSVGLALDLDMIGIAEVANIAALQVCKKVGVAPVKLEKLLHSVEEFIASEEDRSE